MKPIGATSLSSQNAEASRKRIDSLFLRFAAIYGQIWRSQFKGEDFLLFAKQEWQEALRDFEDRVIRLAVQSCRDNSEFPPSMPKFIDLCKSIKRKDVFTKIVPSNELRTIEVGNASLLQIKKLLNMTTKP